jgi:transcriptional regulator with PAS, ATPase and Fis domain
MSTDETTGPASPPTVSLEADDGRAQVRRFRLEVTDGPDRGLAYVSTGDRTSIGTHETASLVLSDATVSRFHCEIALEGGRAVVRDLGSRNGTLIGQVSVLAAPLEHGATLRLGRTALTFDLGSEVVDLPLSARSEFGVLVGSSVPMRRAFALLERAAACDSTVLLDGETGTGKEAAAESIHRESARRDAPFVVVDCASLPATLLESELFGYERGAFTGAAGAREGAFEAAHKGTIFIDEVGELAPDLQPKLLRVLERREVKRLGSNQVHPIDVRIVAATNRNLRTEVNQRRFRSDLYFRLAVLEVRLPPLRDRSDDIPALVEHVLASLGQKDSAEAAFLRARPFQAELARHSWPGNVRELRNHVERCLALQGLAPLDRAPLGGDPAGEWPIDVRRGLREVRDEVARVVERRYLELVMKEHGNNVTAAARAANLDRVHFYRLLSRHGLR